MMSQLVEKIIDTEQNDFFSVLSGKGKIYSFLNPVSYLDALNHKELYSGFDGLFADGSLLVAAIKLLYGRSVTRRSFDMTSIAPLLFEYTQNNNKTIYIVASIHKQVEKAVSIFRNRYPDIKIIGYRNGFFDNDKEMDREANYISDLNPDFLIVGMGAVMQEEFLLRVKNAGFRGIGFTCGGFIRQTAELNDKVDYYPLWTDRMNLRFLYRMFKEPHTRKRYLKAGVAFPIRFVWERFFA